MPLIVAWEPGSRLYCSPTAGSAIAVSLLLKFAMSSAAGTLHSLADLLPGIVENAGQLRCRIPESGRLASI